MRMTGAIGVAALLLLGGCDSFARLDCAGIADRAKRASQTHTLKIAAIANARESARTETDIRCMADATWSDGPDMTVYIRAYKQGDTTMIAYQSTPFE